MSVSGDIAIKILRLIHPGKGSFKDIEKFRKRAEKENAKAGFVMPKNRKAKYELADGTEYPCLIVRSKKNKSADTNKAVLYIYGGVTNCWKIQLDFAVDYADRTGLDVWYPIYPSVSEVNITKSIDVLYDIYSKMTEIYNHKKIAIVGLSFGGSFALEIINRNNRCKNPVGMPGLIIAHSPGGIPDTEEDWEELKKYEEKDPFFALCDLQVIPEIIAHGEEIPNHAITPIHENFKNAPPTYMYYGEEMLAGNSAAYRKAFERDGVGDKLHIDIKKNMMHSYSCMPVFPESKQSYSESVELINKL
ncbi:MAG: alpha/beta hydrolase fold domain-containing protein [Clostridia bacterium]|nr:alpha/beta hydrolase fold domain-containing protein [Clostridia bacterium]